MTNNPGMIVLFIWAAGIAFIIGAAAICVLWAAVVVAAYYVSKNYYKKKRLKEIDNAIDAG